MSPTKEEYSNLCLLLTLNKLTDHPDYKVRTQKSEERIMKLFLFPELESHQGPGLLLPADPASRQGLADGGEERSRGRFYLGGKRQIVAINHKRFTMIRISVFHVEASLFA